jgi:TRAP-type mannitol/chloroaromatic compound transport system permease large subunit
MICLRRRRKRVVIVLMFAFAVALVALYAKSMIPGWFFMLIFAVWILGLSDAGKNLHEELLEYISSDIHIWMTPLYEEFKPPFRRYFRLVFLTRHLLLAVFLTIVPTTSS